MSNFSAKFLHRAKASNRLGHRSSPLTKIYVLAHTKELLSSVPRASGLFPVDLTRLTLPVCYQSNQFAEGRFFLSKEALSPGSAYVGVCSARYDEKWLGTQGYGVRLQNLPAVGKRMSDTDVVAPGIARGWMEQAEEAHPGMGPLINELLQPGNKDAPVPYASTFVCSIKVFKELVIYFNQRVEAAIAKYGTRLPYSYRCPHCGTTSPDGIGMYSSDRHFGFFGERIIMSFFAMHSDLKLRTPESILAGPVRAAVRRAASRSIHFARAVDKSITRFSGEFL